MKKKPTNQLANTDVVVRTNSISKPVRISIDFKTVDQVHLFERFVKRITKDDLQALMFDKSQSEALLQVLGEVRAPLKLIPRYIPHHILQQIVQSSSGAVKPKE